MAVVLACFAAHTLEVWLYALGYFIFDDLLGLGSFAGMRDGTFADYVYFSGVTYTSLGFGDISPLGGPRLIAGVEGLNGLLLIGWSASFTYLVMEQFWPLHGSHAGAASARPGRGRPARRARRRPPAIVRCTN
jgi:Ion channel